MGGWDGKEGATAIAIVLPFFRFPPKIYIYIYIYIYIIFHRMASSHTSCPFPSCAIALASVPALHQHMNGHLRAGRDRSAEPEFVAYLLRFGRRICLGGCRQTLSTSTASHPKCKGRAPLFLPPLHSLSPLGLPRWPPRLLPSRVPPSLLWRSPCHLLSRPLPLRVSCPLYLWSRTFLPLTSQPLRGSL